jgi:hypothetical protein
MNLTVYKVRMRVDAFVNYTAEVEADDPIHAAMLAYNNDYDWKQEDVDEFDARVAFTLDANGEEIPETRWGDL